MSGGSTADSATGSTAGPGDGPAAALDVSGGFTGILQRLAERGDLDRREAAWALRQIVDGSVGEAEAAGFLMALRVKGETADEIAGLLETMRRFVIPVEVPAGKAAVDIVGTGGDHLGTFNISTTAAFVAAGAGVTVAKHGNRAASSLCGSADLLEALGVRVDLGPADVATCIERTGMGFMLAALHHPAMGRVAGVRRALGVRTVFNLLGPLTNPAGVRRQLLGVGAAEYVDVLAEALARTGCEHALVVRGEEGMDELSIAGPSTVVEVSDGAVKSRYVLDPAEYGIRQCALADLAGGGPADNAAITRGILAGSRGAPRDAVVLNAAATLYVAGAAASIREGLHLAAESIDSGRAAGVLEGLVAVAAMPAGGPT